MYTLRKRSVSAFIDELTRVKILGASNLVAHPGAHVGAGEDEGIKTIAHSLDEVHVACPGYNVKVTLEITAGQGSNLGYRFEQIRNMIDATRESDRLQGLLRHGTRFRCGLRYPDERRLPAHIRPNSTRRLVWRCWRHFI